jgi:DUF1680 family protein
MAIYTPFAPYTRKNPASPIDKRAGNERWSNLQDSHELYNVGHMYEAAVAHFLATGKKNFLTLATKNADFLVKTFGEGKRYSVPGHEEIEIGLVKLSRVTGNKSYLELARFFIDQRGKHEHRKMFIADWANPSRFGVLSGSYSGYSANPTCRTRGKSRILIFRHGRCGRYYWGTRIHYGYQPYLGFYL